MVKIKVQLSFKPLVFVFIWSMVGFTAGTETLMGPVRWAAQISQRLGLSQGVEDSIVNIIIVVFVIGSLLVSLWLARLVSASQVRHVKFGIPALLLLATLGSLYFWMNPQIFNPAVPEDGDADAGVKYTFGAYPTKTKLADLKHLGYTTVVSLLHPAVVPFEPKLLGDERKAAAEVGIELLHIPLLPWVSDNRESLQSIKDLVKNGDGRYYFHCYLGKDRINVVRRIISNLDPEGLALAALPGAGAADTSARRLSGLAAFERGRIYSLSGDVFVTPFPTDEEFFSFILNGTVRRVVSLLNPENPEDESWIAKEQRIMAGHGMPFQQMPISLSAYEPQKVLELVEEVRALPGPVVVHGMLSPSFRTQAFIQAYRSGLPPLPPLLFDLPLARGSVSVIAPNIASGPRPTGPEFGNFLYRRGVRRFAYLGDPDTPEAREDRVVTRDAGLAWQAFHPYQDDGDLYLTLAEGGPWYLYGPALAPVASALADRYGPAVPEKALPVEAVPVAGGADTIPDAGEADAVPHKSAAGANPAQASHRGMISRFVTDFFRRGLPDLRLIILASPLFLIYAALGGAFAGWLRVQKKVKTAYTRKIFHFYIFSLAGIIHLSVGFPGVVLFGIIVCLCVMYAVYRGDGFAFYEAMARPKDAPHRTFFIIVPMITTALGGGLANLFFSKYAYLGYFVGGWGDAVGEPVGQKWGKHPYRVPSLLGVPATRTLEGSLAVLFAGIFISLFGVLALGVPLGKAVIVAAACGAAGAAVESVSNHGLDNLTIQVATAAVAYLLLG